MWLARQRIYNIEKGRDPVSQACHARLSPGLFSYAPVGQHSGTVIRSIIPSWKIGGNYGSIVNVEIEWPYGSFAVTSGSVCPDGQKYTG